MLFFSGVTVVPCQADVPVGALSDKFWLGLTARHGRLRVAGRLAG